MIRAQDLRRFEDEIAELFNAGRIRAPIHLESGNEEPLIRIFETIAPEDWVCCSWRSHLKCLLKGVPPERLRDDILAGKSITLTYPEYRIVSSAIVGGILPIALGLAWAAKYRGERTKVWAFLGDMTARTGIYHECLEYVMGHDLPLHFVVEDNGKSVCTPTAKTWGQIHRSQTKECGYHYYSYESKWPHAGSGIRINF